MRNLNHVPVAQEYLSAGQSATVQNSRVGNVAIIPHERRVLSRADLDALQAEGEPVPRCTPASVTPPLCWRTVKS